MPASSAATLRYQRLLDQYRRRTSAGLIAIWSTLDTIDEDRVDDFARQAAPVLAGAKQATVATSAGYFALAAETRPVAIRPEDVTIEPRIRHPFLASWHALNMGRDYEDALRVGRSQASAVGFDFVQETSRLTGDAFAERSGKKMRWYRVPTGKSCDWCIAIAGQSYATAASANFGHDRCDCSVVPADVSSVERVTRTYERGTGRRATGIRRR